MESQSQSGRALAYKLGGFESTASLRIAYSLPNTKAATYLAVLQLGFTTVSIDRRDLPAVRQCPTLEDLKTLHAGFCRAILRSDAVLIPVKSAGKGPTPASQKVKVSLSWADPQDSEKIQSESTITVPVSQLQMVEGQLFVPRWLVRKTLNNRTRATVTNANLPAGQWFGAQQLWDEVFAPAWQLCTEEQAEQARKAAICRQENEQRELERSQRRAAAREAAAIEQAAQQAKKPPAKRTPRPAKPAAPKPAAEEQIIENAVVVWSERRASSTKNEQWLERAEGCTVRFSGQRAYVTKPNGSTLIKTRNTIQINDEAMAPDHAVRKYLEWQAKNPSPATAKG